MYWDGSHWVDETPKPTPKLASTKRRGRDWLSTAIMGLAVIALVIPTLGAFASSTGSGSAAVSTWRTDYAVTTYQETSSRIHYSGRWTRRDHPGYSGGHVRSTDSRNAKATLTFRGSGVAWYGPVGPTRGRAKIYLDGKYVKTISMYARRYRASNVLYTVAFDGSATHRLTIVAQGTSGHPTVAVDRFIVRGDPKVTPAEATVETDRRKPSPAPLIAVVPTVAPNLNDVQDPTPAPTDGPTAAPTSAPTAAPTTAPTSAPTAAPTPKPTTAPSGTKVMTVSSISALKSALADNSVDEIVVKNGTYHVSPSNQVKSDSLWIGSAASGGIAFDARTNPILVRAETRGGVIFDGGGGSAYGGLSFEDGAHHQTWDGFTFQNMGANKTGIIEIGGYSPRRSPHHITLRNITVKRTCTGRATTPDGNTLDHAVYVAHALGTGPHDLLFEDITVDGRGGLASAFHFYHSESGAPNASAVTVRRLHVTGTQQAIILWDRTIRNVTFDDVDISGALAYAIRFEESGPTGIVFSNITSTGSGYKGFYSTLGSSPSGLKFVNTSLN